MDMEKIEPKTWTAIIFGLFIASFMSFLNLAANEIIKIYPNYFLFVFGLYFIFWLFCLCILLNEFGICPFCSRKPS